MEDEAKARRSLGSMNDMSLIFFLRSVMIGGIVLIITFFLLTKDPILKSEAGSAEHKQELVHVPVPYSVETELSLEITAQNILEKKFSSEREWSEFWSKYYATRMPPPTVNFVQSDVLAVFWGPKPSSGFLIRISEVTVGSEGKTVVQVLTCDPDPQQSYLGEVTLPADAVVLPKIHGELVWRYTHGTNGSGHCRGFHQQG